MTKVRTQVQTFEPVSADVSYDRLLANATPEQKHYLTTIANAWNDLVAQNHNQEVYIDGLEEAMREVLRQRDNALNELVALANSRGDAAFHEIVVRVSDTHKINMAAAAWIVNELCDAGRIAISIDAKNALSGVMAQFKNVIQNAGIKADDFLDIQQTMEVMMIEAGE